jgi:glycerol-3-phosphate dehydrogenase
VRLESETFDLLVIGGSVIAAGMLAYAAMSGFRHSRAGMLGPKGAR